VDWTVAGFVGTTCVFEDFQWNLSTDNTTPFPGARFSSPDVLLGPGAMVASWTDLPTVTPSSQPCMDLRSQVTGSGGILLGRVLSAPTPFDLALSVRPANETVKQGKRATFTGTIRNTGDADASGVKVCVKAPKKAIKVKKCVNVGGLAAGDSEKARFNAEAKRSAKPKTYTLRFKTTVSGRVDPARDTAKLKVKER
jgi:uncharacterized repeat protein (TIGR01451 family)